MNDREGGTKRERDVVDRKGKRERDTERKSEWESYISCSGCRRWFCRLAHTHAHTLIQPHMLPIAQCYPSLLHRLSAPPPHAPSPALPAAFQTIKHKARRAHFVELFCCQLLPANCSKLAWNIGIAICMSSLQLTPPSPSALPFSLSVYDCVRELVIKKIFKMAKPKATSSQHELQKTHTHTQNESALLPCVCECV